ncbi:hypothetical protein Tco_0504593 [Tanacetum coccineum]
MGKTIYEAYNQVSTEIIYSDLVTKLLNKSRLKYVSYPRFISCALQVLLGSDYTQDENFGFLPCILSNFNFTEDPSKVTNIELMAHMIVVNSQKDSVCLLPLVAKPKKGKSQSVTPTLPKSQGPKVPGALSKKSKRPKSKKPPTKTNYGLPSTLDEGTRKSKPLLESTATHPKDSGGNIQSLDRDLTSTTYDEGTAKTTPHPEGSLGDIDLGGNIPPADMEPIHPTIADLSGTGAKYQSDEEEVLATGEDMGEDPQVVEEVRTSSPKQDQPEPSHVQKSTSDLSSPDLKKFDNILPLTKR